LVVAPRAELHDSLGMNAQDFQLFPDDTLRYGPAQVFHLQMHRVILWEQKSVKSQTPTPVEGTQSTD